MAKVEVRNINPGKRFLAGDQCEYLMLKQPNQFVMQQSGHRVAVRLATGEPAMFHKESLVTPVGE